MERTVAQAKQRALAAPAYTGFGSPSDLRTIQRCRSRFVSDGLINTILFTRDEGMHACGWWKNPDYERCLHLSLSFTDRETGEFAPHNHALAKRWCELFFDSMVRLLWVEPPYSDEGKRRDVWHYRVFMHSDWKTPLLPRGEVYTREFTERGWKSWSDLHGQKQESEHE